MIIFISFFENMNDLFRAALHPKAYIIHTNMHHIVALYKPCDVMSIPNENQQINLKSLIHMPYDFKQRCYFLPDHQKFFLLNRLDAPTSGILVGCFDEQIAHIIRECFFKQAVQKTYYALTRYKKIPEVGEFQDCLGEHFDRGHLRVIRGRGERAVAKYYVEKNLEFGETSILKLRLEPITGRTHQLRVQCASRNIPIVGDKTSGDFLLNKKIRNISLNKRLYLQSCAIKFQYKLYGKEYLFSSEISCEF
ncbi:MAG: RNA pseudouridine synthase [Puniceicoccales bacterium]|jgi:23S rRNA-/tRNA-specific pseudouridylate synthase|nr:RNA pseudouridine synthase [Puniceicoccales bacterium]